MILILCRPRWLKSRDAIKTSPTKEQLSKIKYGNDVSKSQSDEFELNELDISTGNDVEGLDIHDQKERDQNSRGLKTLAKIFNKDRGAVSETPTIFALLRASHIVSKYFFLNDSAAD